MAVGSGQVALAFDEFRASRAAPGPARLALHVVEGCSYGFPVGGLDFERGDGTAQAPQQRDRLGSREGEIEAGNRAARRDAAHSQQRLPVRRVAAGEHRFELVGADLALKAEACGGVAKPFPGASPSPE